MIKLGTRTFFILIALLSGPIFLSSCKGRVSVEKKQIVLISVDTLRGDHVSPAGYLRNTSPHLLQLVKESVYFTQAYPNGCWTMPSHMSLLTGTLPSRHGIIQDWQSMTQGEYPKMNDRVRTVSEILQTQGVSTIKFARLPEELGFGKGYDRNRGSDPLEDEGSFNRLLADITQIKDEDFFLFIHTWMVHAPYSNSRYLAENRFSPEERAYIDGFRSSVPRGVDRVRLFREFLINHDLYNRQDCVTMYDSGIYYVDAMLGRLFEKCRELGIYDQMMLIVVSDHGEHFSEHYPRQFYDYHGKDFYEEFIKVPLIVKYPLGYRVGTQDKPVALVDVVPTILDFYGIEIPGFMQGDSLLKANRKRSRGYVVSEAISLNGVERKMIRKGDLKYIVTMPDPEGPARMNWRGINEKRLFDLKSDPKETINLFPDMSYRKTCNEMERALLSVIQLSVELNTGARKTKLSDETLEHLKSLGYIK
jgi:arylsulfatase A-like enzyme